MLNQLTEQQTYDRNRSYWVVIEHDGRYGAVPTGRRHDTDSTYVLRVSADVRIELMPGAR